MLVKRAVQTCDYITMSARVLFSTLMLVIDIISTMSGSFSLITYRNQSLDNEELAVTTHNIILGKQLIKTELYKLIYTIWKAGP